MSIWVGGLDLGQSQDYSALVILEVEGDKSGGDEVLPFEKISVCHIERFPLGTKYREVAELCEDRLRRTPMPRYFSIDSTGVGLGVVELLGRLNPAEITITSGAEVGYGDRPQQFRVPKKNLVAALAVPLQNQILKIASSLPHADLLINELLNIRVKVSEAGHDSYGAWRESIHGRPGAGYRGRCVVCGTGVSGPNAADPRS
jgi:hypothetical protein